MIIDPHFIGEYICHSRGYLTCPLATPEEAVMVAIGIAMLLFSGIAIMEKFSNK